MCNVAVVGYNRFEYFRDTLNSILQSTAPLTNVYIFLDGPNNDSVQQHIEYAQEAIPEDICNIITSKTNLGCSRNVIRAREYLFENIGIDQAFIFEDDMVVSRNYLQLCLNIQEWLAQTYPDNDFIIQGWNENLLFKTKGLENCIQNTQCHWWGYLMTRKIWMKIHPIVQEYKKLVNCHYDDRPHQKIVDLLDPYVQYGAHNIKHYTNFPINKKELDRICEVKGTDQDMMTAAACLYNGILKVAPVISRGTSIGRLGVHMNDRVFQHLNLHLIEKYEDNIVPTQFVLYNS